jgi:hypothetical protein
MAGVRTLRRIQIGRESTAGTAVAATTYWRGQGTIEDTLSTQFPLEDVGILGGVNRSYIDAVGGKLEMDDTPATYEQLPYILESGIASQSPAQDGAGTLYIYTYTVPTTSQGTWRTHTIEGGDDQQEEEMAYCFVPEFNLKGKAASEALMVSATWEGRQVAPSTFTGSLSIPAVEDIPFRRGRLYIDGTGTFPATTQRANTFLEMDLKVDTGLRSVPTADGELYFSFVKRIEPEIVLDITFEHDSIATAEKAAWRAGTARSVRLDFTGTAGTGTTYSTKRLIIDLMGKYEKIEKLDEMDGNDIVKATLRCRYDLTGASAGRFIIVSLLSSLP